MSNAATGLSALQEALSRAGLQARFRQEDPQAWTRGWERLAHQSVRASSAMIDYQQAYLEGVGWEICDASLVLLNDGQPAGLWPLTLGGPSGLQLTSQGGAVGEPLFTQGLSPRTAKRLASQCIEVILNLAGTLGKPVTCSETALPGQASLGLSEWYQQWLTLGSEVQVRHDLYVHLEPSMADIRTGFRKSYKPLISVGLRSWEVHVLDSAEGMEANWPAFVELHREVAGRVTRPAETWELQRRMILAGEALLIHLVDPADGRMVGGGFFQMTRDEALYSVAAYDRTLFDKPLGHVVQARAIECFKALGQRWYRLGERSFPGDRPAPTDKELAIAAFKQGFASHLVPRFLIQPPALVGSPEVGPE